jgi:hypothetical protein
MTMRFPLLAGLLATLTLAGCGEYEPSQPRRRSAAPEAVGVAVDPFSMGAPVRKQQPQKAPVASEQGPAAKQPASWPDEPPPGMVREKADVGAGKKGHYGPGFITTPLATYWRSQEMVAYRIKVPHALNLYKGMHGHFPKTQEEFEREILKPNKITLPDLPEGHRYAYDPQKGELLVERPR